MSDDWKVGDLAVCVDAAPRPESVREGGGLIAVGKTYTVDGIHPDGDGLWLVEAPTLCAFWADRFRKIRPDEHEACEVEFVDLLKLSKRKVEA